MEKTKFIKAIADDMLKKDVSLFTGAGTSIDAGAPTWNELFRPLMDDLDLKERENIDLFLVAQYYENDYGQSKITNLLVEKLNYTLDINKNSIIYKALKLPFKTLWTTNFDHVIEKVLEQENIKVVKIFKDQNLSVSTKYNHTLLYKINGDISDPSSMVVTKKHIENYKKDHEIMLTFLKKELVANTFLFLGYSFMDGIILENLSLLRECVGEQYNRHYTILKRENDKYFEHFVDDLEKRYNIVALLVDSYDEIPSIIDSINEKLRNKRVFISGSYDVLDADELKLSDEISRELVSVLYNPSYDYRICTGVGKKIGAEITGYAYQYLISKHYANINNYLIMRPFPFHNKELAKEKGQEHRIKLIRDNKFAIFLFGKSTGYEFSQGVLDEFEIAKQNNLVIIPVGATGYSAKIIWKEVKENITLYPYLESYIDKLNDEKDGKKLANIIIAIINNYIETNQ